MPSGIPPTAARGTHQLQQLVLVGHSVLGHVGEGCFLQRVIVIQRLHLGQHHDDERLSYIYISPRGYNTKNKHKRAATVRDLKGARRVEEYKEPGARSVPAYCKRGKHTSVYPNASATTAEARGLLPSNASSTGTVDKRHQQPATSFSNSNSNRQTTINRKQLQQTTTTTNDSEQQQQQQPQQRTTKIQIASRTHSTFGLAMSISNTSSSRPFRRSTSVPSEISVTVALT